MIADTVFMVRPASFGYDEDTASSNAFQERDDSMTSEEIQHQAVQEFDGFVDRLRAVGIRVVIGQDQTPPSKPSAIFPNNWISFHYTGALITYPLAAPSRRLEREEAFITSFGKDFEIAQRIHLEAFEKEEKYLEGTGSMVLDRSHRVAYACESLRTHPDLLQSFCDRFQYKAIGFKAVDRTGIPIYHTNVLMAMGDHFVVICMDCIPDAKDKEKLNLQFRENGKEIIEINHQQMASFAGNMLLLQNDKGEKYLAMSEQARKSLTQDQVHRLEQYTKLLSSPLYTIEKAGGGSARCMLAELLLPRKAVPAESSPA